MKKRIYLLFFLVLPLSTILLFAGGCDSLEDLLLSEYTLTILVEGNGSTNPLPNSHRYTENSQVLLTAIPDDNHLFSHWIGNVANRYQKSTSIIMNSNQSVTAVFYHEDEEQPLPQYTLTMASFVGEGEVNPEVGSHSYPEGTEVELDATPATGWLFSHWEGDVASSQGSNTTILIDGDKEVKAFFSQEGERDVIPINSNIDSPTTWSGDNLYVIGANITINALLTIEPGTIVKFEEGRRMTIRSGGGIRAQGTETRSIVFTSIKDDLHGGDTNQDGDLTSPAPGDWEYIYVQSGTALFEYCSFYYGGGSYTDATLIIDSTATVKNSTFAYNTGNRIGALDARSSATIEGNTFYGNVRPLRLNASLDLPSGNIFYNPSDPEETNTFQGIFIDGTSVSRNVTWEEDEVPFVLTSSLTIGNDYQLTLKEGVILKFDETRLTINGRLSAVGQEDLPIIFTSFKDDAHGGDSNGDGDFTSPAPGDWEYIAINGTGILEYCQFLYGGSAYNDYTLLVNGTTSLKNSTFAYNTGDRRGALYAQSGITMEGNIFYQNRKPMTLNPSISLDNSNIFHNPNQPQEKNTFQGIFIVGTSVSRNVTWEEREVPFVLTSNLSIGADYQLTLEEGVILKFNETRLVINGRLNAKASETKPIIFTSYQDDTHGGDSNGDGSATAPAPGDWEYIAINGTADFRFCHFYYGGGAYDDYTLMIGGATTVTDSIFAYNQGDRLGTLDVRSQATISDNIFYHNIKPIRLHINLDLDDSNTFHNPKDPNERNIFEGIFIEGGTITQNVTWEEKEIAFVLRDGTTTVNEGGSLTLGDGVTIKFRLNRGLSHHDNINNYDGSDVYFTSYRDDTRGGDSNGDGDGTSPAWDDWDGIRKAYSPYSYETWDTIKYAKNH